MQGRQSSPNSLDAGLNQYGATGIHMWNAQLHRIEMIARHNNIAKQLAIVTRNGRSSAN